MTTNIESAKQYGIKSKYLSSSELKKHFPYLNFSESDEAIYEMDNSGYISPRRLVDAQIQNARQNGCQILFETVNEVKRCVQNGNYIMYRYLTIFFYSASLMFTRYFSLFFILPR
jgi:glycine/D-amino acid oxidase-like deaminating enzyme